MTPPPPIARWFAEHERAATIASWIIVAGTVPAFFVQVGIQELRMKWKVKGYAWPSGRVWAIFPPGVRPDRNGYRAFWVTRDALAARRRAHDWARAGVDRFAA